MKGKVLSNEKIFQTFWSEKSKANTLITKYSLHSQSFLANPFTSYFSTNNSFLTIN